MKYDLEAEKGAILQVIATVDEEGSGGISLAAFETLFSRSLDATAVDGLKGVMRKYTNPATGSLDYVRFLDWMFESDRWNSNEGSNSKVSSAPILAPALQNMLQPLEPEASFEKKKLRNRPPPVLMSSGDVKSRIQVRRLKTLKSIKELEVPADSMVTGPLAAQDGGRVGSKVHTGKTITGREIAEAPAVAQVAGTSDKEFKGIIGKGSASGAVLEHFSDMISNDVFGLPFSVSIAIPTIEDTPLIAISEGFTKLTGYTQEEIVGWNCRLLLEGVPKEEVLDQTRQESRRYCRAAYLRGLTRLSHSFLIQRNARKSGELFWNLFMLSLIPGPNSTSFIVGLQLDLGPDLDLKEGSDITDAIAPHAENLKIVQQMLFGHKLGQQISGDLNVAPDGLCPNAFKDKALGMGLADDIKDWVSQAEAASALFQSWGTLPWAVWPSTSKYALVNGGTSVIRLEADEVPRGGVAMSIFPLKKTPRGVSVKIRIEEVCNFERDLSKGGWLPCIGFTEVTPAAMDSLGGLPPRIESTAKSVCLRGDGRVFIRSEETHWSESDVLRTETCVGEPSPYVIKAGDTVECLWGKGLIEVSMHGDDGAEQVYKVKDKAIPKPAKTPMYALMDCCYATCKATLVV